MKGGGDDPVYSGGRIILSIVTEKTAAEDGWSQATAITQM